MRGRRKMKGEKRGRRRSKQYIKEEEGEKDERGVKRGRRRSKQQYSIVLNC